MFWTLIHLNKNPIGIIIRTEGTTIIIIRHLIPIINQDSIDSELISSLKTLKELGSFGLWWKHVIIQIITYFSWFKELWLIFIPIWVHLSQIRLPPSIMHLYNNASIYLQVSLKIKLSVEHRNKEKKLFLLFVKQYLHFSKAQKTKD